MWSDTPRHLYCDVFTFRIIYIGINGVIAWSDTSHSTQLIALIQTRVQYVQAIRAVDNVTRGAYLSFHLLIPAVYSAYFRELAVTFCRVSRAPIYNTSSTNAQCMHRVGCRWIIRLLQAPGYTYIFYFLPSILELYKLFFEHTCKILFFIHLMEI